MSVILCNVAVHAHRAGPHRHHGAHLKCTPLHPHPEAQYLLAFGLNFGLCNAVTLCILIMLAVTAIMVRLLPCTSHIQYLDGIAIECEQLLALLIMVRCGSLPPFFRGPRLRNLGSKESRFKGIWGLRNLGSKESGFKMKELSRGRLLLRATGS